MDRGVAEPDWGGGEPGRRQTPEQQRDDDDRLLDLLRGAAGPDRADGPPAIALDWTGGDPPPAAEVTAWLAAWRDELSAGIGPASLDLGAVPSAVAASRGRRTRWRRLLLSAGAVVVVAGGGGGVAAAADSQPGGTLWPVTRLVYPERAQARLAQQDAQELLDTARSALADGRYEEVQRLLLDADPLVSRVMDPAERRRLADDLAEIRRLVGLLQVRQSPPAADPRDDPPADDRAGLEVPLPRPSVLPTPPGGDPGSGATPGPGAPPAPRISPVIAPTEPPVLPLPSPPPPP